MSVCSASSPIAAARVPAAVPAWVRAVVVVALALAVLPSPASARHHIFRSYPRARHVVVDSHGVMITGDSTAADSVAHARVHVGDGVIDINGEGDQDVDVDVHDIHVHGDGAALVRVFADAEVPAGHRIDGDVVAVFGSVDVLGQVSGDVVAVFGSVRLRPGASVSGDVVSIGGALDHAPGATVGGQSVSLGFLPFTWGVPALPTLLGSVFAMWLATLLFGWALAALAHDRLVRASLTASRHTAGSFFLGVLSMPLLVLAMALLFVTVVGIPVALLLPAVYALLVWAGQVTGVYLLGCRLVRRTPGEGGVIGPIAAGGLLVALFFVLAAVLAGPQGAMRSAALFCALLGGLLALGLGALGTGALLLSRLGQRAPDLRPAMPPPPAVTPAPLPPTVA